MLAEADDSYANAFAVITVLLATPALAAKASCPALGGFPNAINRSTFDLCAILTTIMACCAFTG